MTVVYLRVLVATTFLPTAWTWASRSFVSVPWRWSQTRRISSSQSLHQPRSMATSSYTVCTTCRGQGKIKRAPSKKQKLRHKRAKLQDDNTPLPSRIDPCKKCNQTGLSPTSDFDSEVKATSKRLPQVAIIGGGLGGLALGIALSHRGIPFQIFERDTSFLQRKQGYGLTLQQASRALASFGINALEEGVTSTRHVVHTIDGKAVGEWGFRKWGREETKRPPKRQNVHIARQALRRELLDALGGEKQIFWGHKLIGMSKRDDFSIELDFEVENGNLVRRCTDLVVGADGIRSTVRKYLIGLNDNSTKTTPLRYLHCVVVLGICPLENLDRDTKEIDLMDGATVFQTADGSTRIYFMPYSPTACMWQLSFPMEDEAMAKDLSRRGPAALKDEALTRCGTWHKPIPEILQQTPIDLVSGYPVYDRDLITTEMLNTTTPITLIGDAAHPMSPFKGQGANQALLDALSLARCLYSCSRKEDNIDDIFVILSKYHEEMIGRSTKKVQASAQAAQFLHTEVAIQEGNVTRGAAAAASTSINQI